MSSKKSREERIAKETAKQLGESIGDRDGWYRTAGENVVTAENQKFWAYYRALDESQSGVKELVDPRAETSQSTVSRVIRQKDDEVLYDDEALDLVGKLEEETVDLYPEEWLEAYRQVLAEAKADLEALSHIANTTTQTPEWAARRHPELVGCNRHVFDNLTGETEYTDDTHLNGLESVNTDRWR
jgi:hypothetical protein